MKEGYMGRITETYDRVSSQAERKVTCPGCDKKRTIKRTFYQTVNPFNRNDDGSPKTYLEVLEAVTQEAMEWKPPEHQMYHDKCWDDAKGESE